MDIIKFNNNPSTPTRMENGEILHGFSNVTWIERYRDAGEFTFEAPISSGLKDLLPIGTFITHKDSLEIMIVEDQEINETADGGSIKITGRGLETWLYNRVVGANFGSLANHQSPVPVVWVSKIPDYYTLNKDYAWAQAMQLFNEHVSINNLVDDNDTFPYLDMFSIAFGGRQATRKVDRGLTLYEAIVNLLAIQNFGIRVIRPSVGSGMPNQDDTTLLVHKGNDLSASVVFSYDGDIETADYLWSNRAFKNYAYVRSTWFETYTDNKFSAAENLRRYIYVDAKDLDDQYNAAPGGSTQTNILIDMMNRAQDELEICKNTNLMKVDVRKQQISYQYRKDYNVGDLVNVRGNYGQHAIMRVTEHAEIEDANGEQSYPTLTVEET